MRNATWRLFLTVQIRVIERIQEQLSAANLPPLEWYDVLWALQETPDRRLRLSELADRVLLSRSNLTRLLDRLEKNELLYREPCPTDRRGTFAVLTEAGAAMQKQMWAIYSEGIAEYFGDRLSDEEVKVMQQGFKKILGASDRDR
ncbi:MarR family transcriptional regulator [Kamptonema animale CS-326]|jgi:DNA-binding MarR family transcriptional regulator|uniref:MarR family winged helix-turn-helix transcriptional regulator n=1 Tax=Kamptonema animale TaxID=92934 RepID=UPI00232ED4F5|nr:MarR family transcriptional regulator [Kamptonema animale]MDB9513850.1 MarR family transcriptional regulator [Kamptonema animale CS-326]